MPFSFVESDFDEITKEIFKKLTECEKKLKKIDDKIESNKQDHSSKLKIISENMKMYLDNSFEFLSSHGSRYKEFKSFFNKSRSNDPSVKNMENFRMELRHIFIEFKKICDVNGKKFDILEKNIDEILNNIKSKKSLVKLRLAECKKTYDFLQNLLKHPQGIEILNNTETETFQKNNVMQENNLKPVDLKNDNQIEKQTQKKTNFSEPRERGIDKQTSQNNEHAFKNLYKLIENWHNINKSISLHLKNEVEKFEQIRKNIYGIYLPLCENFMQVAFYFDDVNGDLKGKSNVSIYLTILNDIHYKSVSFKYTFSYEENAYESAIELFYNVKNNFKTNLELPNDLLMESKPQESKFLEQEEHLLKKLNKICRKNRDFVLDIDTEIVNFINIIAYIECPKLKVGLEEQRKEENVILKNNANPLLTHKMHR